MNVRVLFLGPARELAGAAEMTIDLHEGACVSDLRRALTQSMPRLGAALSGMRVAVNQSFAADAAALAPGDEVALIPPVSGGGAGPIMVDLAAGALAVGRIVDWVRGDPAHGAICTFEGVTRQEHDAEHGSLIGLEYEVFESMALPVLHGLAVEAGRRWGARRVAMVHRVGRVAPGEASVVIAVACPHRAEAFSACRWLIDQVKREVPIWKRDVFADGFARWVKSDAFDQDTQGIERGAGAGEARPAS